MSDLNLNPYSVIPSTPGMGFDVTCAGLGYPVLSEMDGADARDAADALNAAYAKGVQDERARKLRDLYANHPSYQPRGYPGYGSVDEGGDVMKAHFIKCARAAYKAGGFES